MHPRLSLASGTLIALALAASGAQAAAPGYTDLRAVHARPTELRWRDPVRASLTFTRFPEASGDFELEVYCGANFPIEELRLGVFAGAGVELAELPRYQGGLLPGGDLVWRIAGRFSPGTEFPPAVSLAVDYLFPYEAVAEDVYRNRRGFDRPAELRPFLVRLAGMQGTRDRILKTVPVVVAGGRR